MSVYFLNTSLFEENTVRISFFLIICKLTTLDTILKKKFIKDHIDLITYLKRIFSCACIGSLLFCLPITTASADTEQPFSTLIPLGSVSIKDKKAGLTEPSGLWFSAHEKVLWTVSDDTKKAFKLSLDGQILEQVDVDLEDAEGITQGVEEDFLYIAQEDGSKVAVVNSRTGTIVNEHDLSTLRTDKGEKFDFLKNDTIHGLEGITFNPNRNSFFLLKERDPGLLIEISADFKFLREFRSLSERPEFQLRRLLRFNRTIDLAGIEYQRREGKDYFWIVTDEGKTVFLYNWDDDRLEKRFPLLFPDKNGNLKSIDKAEGVAFNPELNQLYFVSDKTACLYRFQVP